jgi:acetyl-CoA carboxylase biotin carboxylase subunit
MFKSILIANRGEIAWRIMRTCRRLGVKTIAVFSEADRTARHVEMADEAVCIGPAEARLSYLDVAAILDAAKRTGAAGLHPGYGFLAENASFAEACDNAGLTFIGPSTSIIASMGSKIKAKAVAEAAGLPVVPGYYGDDQSDRHLAEQAAILGPPLLIKASAGGGGRGMRRVDDLADFDKALAAARAEAMAAFGDADVLLERYVKRPRHIEVQLLCDRQGKALHLFDRDCSVQRNHQKIIEEAPAPDLSPQTRDQLTGYALKLAQTIGYDSVGTVEFMVDRADGQIYFLEMNTRLQVEHPVTEMITGLDIIEWQIRVAAGEKLPFGQDDIQLNGWAMEARIAAEDPAQDYRPQTGVLSFYRDPAGPGTNDIRVDSGLHSGLEITPYYDSMIAKLIAHGADREAARVRLLAALQRFHIGGVGSNIAFLADIVGHPAFAAADIDTTFIRRAFPDGWRAPATSARHIAEAALAYFGALDDAENPSPWRSLGAWRLIEQAGAPGAAVLYISQGEAPARPVRIVGRGSSYIVEIDGEAPIRFTAYDGVLDAHVDESRVTLFRGAATHEFKVGLAEQVLLGGGAAGQGGGDVITAPMPGLVAAVMVEVGQRVEEGQTLVVLEAMKLMQNLGAPRAGVVARLNCRPGDSVAGGAVLIDLESEE